MKKGGFFIVFFLVFLCALVSAKDYDILYRDNIKTNVDISTDITIKPTSSSYSVNYINAKLSFYPKDTFRQKVLSMDVIPFVEPSDDIIDFRWDDVDEEKLSLRVDSEIESYNKFKKVKTKVKFPITNIEESVEEYTQAGELIDLSDEILDLATSLAEGEDDLYKVVYHYAVWVNTNVEYSLSTLTSQASQKSTWVLENRQGVCDEITNLFISLCRSVGIPARFVSGMAFTNSPLFEKEWGAHGWAEVYFPGYGWVPFDVTYGEFGYLDAGHIKFKNSIDSDKSSINYEWQSSRASVSAEPLDIDIDVIQKGGFSSFLLDISAKTLGKRVGFGSYNLIEAELANKQDYYVIADTVLQGPRELDIINEQKQFIFIEPKSTAKVLWMVKAPSDLEKNKIYTFPLVINTIRNQTHSLSFDSLHGGVNYDKSEIEDIFEQRSEESEKTYSKNLYFKCVSPPSAGIGEAFQINCSLNNLGNTNLGNIEVCLESDCREISLTIAQKGKITFTKQIDEKGDKRIMITAKNDEVSKSSMTYITVLDKPELEIINLDYPDSVNYGGLFDISFTLSKKSVATPKDIDIYFYLNNVPQAWTLDELTENKAYKVNIRTRDMKLNNNIIKIVVFYKDESFNKYSTEKSLDIFLNVSSFPQKISAFFREVVFRFRELFSGT